MYMYIHTRAHTCIHTYEHTVIDLCACVCMCVCARACVRARVREQPVVGGRAGARSATCCDPIIAWRHTLWRRPKPAEARDALEEDAGCDEVARREDQPACGAAPSPSAQGCGRSRARTCACEGVRGSSNVAQTTRGGRVCGSTVRGTSQPLSRARHGVREKDEAAPGMQTRGRQGRGLTQS